MDIAIKIIDSASAMLYANDQTAYKENAIKLEIESQKAKLFF